MYCKFEVVEVSHSPDRISNGYEDKQQQQQPRHHWYRTYLQGRTVLALAVLTQINRATCLVYAGAIATGYARQQLPRSEDVATAAEDHTEPVVNDLPQCTA